MTGGEFDPEGRAFFFLAFDANGPSMSLDDLADDNESKAEGAFARSSFSFGLVVDGKEFGDERRGDADALV